MSNILDQLGKSPQFIPATTDEFLALRLAKCLSDEAAIARYLHYVAHYPISQLFRLCHRAKQTHHPAVSFHSFLKQSNQ